MGKYAANTSVSSELSWLEIEKTLIRFEQAYISGAVPKMLAMLEE